MKGVGNLPVFIERGVDGENHIRIDCHTYRVYGRFLFLTDLGDVYLETIREVGYSLEEHCNDVYRLWNHNLSMASKHGLLSVDEALLVPIDCPRSQNHTWARYRQAEFIPKLPPPNLAVKYCLIKDSKGVYYLVGD